MSSSRPTPDDEGFTSWVLARRTGLRRQAYLLCGDWSAADDVVQDCLVRMYRHWPHASDSPDRYAQKVLVSVVIDRARRPWRREASVADVPDAPVDDPEPVSASAVLAALQTVPTRQRAVLVLRFWSDLSVEQTAEALGVSVGTVKSQSARGLETLRRHLSVEIDADADSENEVPSGPMEVR